MTAMVDSFPRERERERGGGGEGGRVGGKGRERDGKKDSFFIIICFPMPQGV